MTDEMFSHFQTILNSLQAFGYEFSKTQNNLKILNNLSEANNSKSLDERFSDSSSDEVSPMSKKFKKMLNKKCKNKHSFKRKDKYKKFSKEESIGMIICFKYKKTRHMKVDYPKLKKR
ncbi:hypothetical protein CR513_35293, partial [Mucuna pruriens]